MRIIVPCRSDRSDDDIPCMIELEPGQDSPWLDREVLGPIKVIPETEEERRLAGQVELAKPKGKLSAREVLAASGEMQTLMAALASVDESVTAPKSEADVDLVK